MFHSVKRGLDERLTTTQILLQQQEEAVRRGDRERRALSDRVKELERSLQSSEADKKHTQVHALLYAISLTARDHGRSAVAIWLHSTVDLLK